jgi:hypothetical protein
MLKNGIPQLTMSLYFLRSGFTSLLSNLTEKTSCQQGSKFAPSKGIAFVIL